jgi:DNA-binding LacI/PurR family transcriptional regulator
MASTVDTTHRRATLSTVAEAVGVSRMTVSNAYNRPDQLSPALRERILETARELGYPGPDPVARTLSRGRTGTAGVIFDQPLPLAFSDPAAVLFLEGIATECETRAIGLTLVPRLETGVSLVEGALVDGFVLYCTPEDDVRLAAVRRRRVPYVRVDYAPGEDTLDVGIDDAGAAREICEHLLALGHRRFAIVLPDEGGGDTPAEAKRLAQHNVVAARLAGWGEALRAAGVDWDAVPVAVVTEHDRSDARRGVGSLLDRAPRPTAVLAFSDLLALDVLEAARRRGIPVPAELSIAGFDDIPAAALSSPPLTTIRQPHIDKGVHAVRLLLDATQPETVVLPTELVVRASTAPVPST